MKKTKLTSFPSPTCNMWVISDLNDKEAKVVT